jgi:hypothetical protein
VSTVYVTIVHDENESVPCHTVWGGLSTEEYLRSLRGEEAVYEGKIEELNTEIAAAEKLVEERKATAQKGVRTKKEKAKKE